MSASEAQRLRVVLEVTADCFAVALEVIAAQHRASPNGDIDDLDQLLLDGQQVLHNAREALRA